MFKIITRLLPLLLAFHFFHPGNAGAQQSDRPPNLSLGDLVVTGFSGTIAPNPNQRRPANRSALDTTFINPDGPSVRIVDVSRPGYVWDGRLFPAPKRFDVSAKDVGQVFGVALDDQPAPNIYAAATSVFGLHLVSRGRDGLPERRKTGGPGVGWMRGQFGLDLQGGPGGIYKIDGRTGTATLFANVTLDGVPNPGPGLGNLAYDSANKQLFVSDLYTGMIHRFDLDGRDLGRYDHGVTGLGAAGLPPQPFNPANRPNIASARFDSEKPDTWGFAPSARRVWGLAVHEGRLYYSVVAGPQVWSVGIQQDGSFAADPRWELDVPAQSGPLPISDIAFSQRGAMILAQRALIAGSYDYFAFTRPGEPQVFRLWLKGPNDPPSPGRWKLIPEEYAVGFAGNYRNTNGGVALGYGYASDGTLSSNACEFSLWTTAQNMRNAPPLRSQLDPGGPLVVHGVQGLPASPVRDVNTPPWLSYSVAYRDVSDDPRAAGHLGSVRTYTRPCSAPAVYSGPGYPANPPYVSGTTTTIVTPAVCVGPNCPPPPNCPPNCPPPSGNPIDLGIAKIGEVNLANPNGPYNFTIGVRNLGALITGPSTLTFTDVVPAGMTFTNITSSNWTCAPVVGPPIPAGGTLTCTYSGSFPIAVSQALGWVTIVATGGNGPYTNCARLGQPDGDPSNDRACVTVEKNFGNLIVSKEIINKTNPRISTTGLVFPVTVTCGSTVTILNLVDGLPQTVNSIPYGTTCTALEGTPPIPTGLCANGQPPTWSGPAYVPSNSAQVVSGTTSSINVQNTLECGSSGGQVGELMLEKVVATPGISIGLIYPVTVTCGSSVTNLNLIDGITQTVSNLPLGASCTIVETPPPPPANFCPPGSTPVWSTSLVPPGVPLGSVTITGSTVSVMVRNTLACSPINTPVTFTVTKEVINHTNPQIPTTGMVFAVSTSCQSGSSPAVVTNMSLANNGSQTVTGLALNTVCTITEIPPIPPSTGPVSCGAPGSTLVWTTVIPAPVTITGPGMTALVKNILDCNPPSSGLATFTVTKEVINHTSIPVPASTVYAISASCVSGTSPAVVTPMPLNDGGSQTVTGLVLNTVCTITEIPPIPPSTGPVSCGAPGSTLVWTTVIPAPVTITGPGMTALVKNILDCNPPGSGGGSLKVTKTIVNKTQGQISTAGLSYPITVSCTSGGSPAMVTNFGLADNGSQTVNNIALNSSCMVAEGTMPTPTGTCATGGAVATWTMPPIMTPSSPVPVNGSAVTLTLQNTIECKVPGGHGYYRVTKFINNQTSNTNAALNAFVFPTTSTCSDGSTNSLNVQRLVPGIVTNIPVGATCSVVETLPAAPATGCPPRKVAVWGTPTYSPASVTIVSGAGPAIQMTNVLSCVDEPRTALPPVCKPPLVQGARPGVCVCPAGTVQEGRDCVRPTVCNAPAKLNSRGACECPQNMVARGNGCVARERQQPSVAPNDIIRGLPGLFGPGGGGRQGPDGPRGDGPGRGGSPGLR